jgi:hypothetical protein
MQEYPACKETVKVDVEEAEEEKVEDEEGEGKEEEKEKEKKKGGKERGGGKGEGGGKEKESEKEEEGGGEIFFVATGGSCLLLVELPLGLAVLPCSHLYMDEGTMRRGESVCVYVGEGVAHNTEHHKKHKTPNTYHNT